MPNGYGFFNQIFSIEGFSQNQLFRIVQEHFVALALQAVQFDGFTISQTEIVQIGDFLEIIQIEDHRQYFNSAGLETALQQAGFPPAAIRARTFQGADDEAVERQGPRPALSPEAEHGFDITLLDLLPDGATGGMCDTTPEILSARVFESDGVTPVPGKGPLVLGADYSLTYNGATCELTLNTLSAAAVIGVDERLMIVYRTQLDTDTQDGALLTNVAGAIAWETEDGSTQYRRTLTDGTVQRLMVVPDGPLSLLPFATLVVAAAASLPEAVTAGEARRLITRRTDSTVTGGAAATVCAIPIATSSRRSRAMSRW